MASDDPIRASDSDRDAVVAALREAYTEGRLTLDEFGERMAAAYAGRTWGELRGLTGDLPVQPVLGADLPDRPALSAASPPAAAPLPPQLRPPRAAAPRRRNPVAILIPIAVWTLIAVHGGAAHGVVVLILTALVVSVFVAALRRR